MLEADTSRRAYASALEIGERLLEAMAEPPREDVNGERFGNRDLNGSVGYALAFLALAKATGDERFSAAMHEQFKRAANAGGSALGLFDGLGGLRAVAALATSLEPRYARLVQQCDSLIDSAFPFEFMPPKRAADYDLVSGWAGIRLARCIDGSREEDPVTNYLQWLLGDQERLTVTDGETGEPACFLGVAHGMAGILAALVSTLDPLPETMRLTLRRGARFLIDHARELDGLPVWPRSVQCPPDFAARAVLCYGTPGIALTLLRIARGIGDAAIEAFALDVLRKLASHPVDSIMLNGSGICHGSIGVALAFHVAARHTGEAIFERACNAFVTRTLDGRDAAGKRCFALGNDGVRYDAIGEVYGAAGIAIALLSLDGRFDERWLRIHAIGTPA